MITSIEEYHDTTILPFAEICRKVAAGEHFAFARFGDGEFYALVGTNTEGQNCDGHQYFEDLGIALAQTLLDCTFLTKPGYYLGLHMSRRNGPESVDWLQEHNITPDTYKFAQNAVFHDAVVKKHNTDIADFYKACEGKNVLLIGPAHLKRQTKITLRRFIECPAKNSWKATDAVLSMANQAIRPGDVVLLCVGPPAPVWIGLLYSVFQDTVTLIDFGSTLDPASGVNSRSFHNKI
jgi:hypothetical protein